MADQVRAHWLWELVSEKGESHGYVEAVGPRDALSRALTTTWAETGQLVGEVLGVSPETIQDAPANGDLEYVAQGEGFKLLVRKVVCPTKPRHDGDIFGCGSVRLAGPDHEGWFDCLECGMGFNPRTCNDPVEAPSMA